MTQEPAAAPLPKGKLFAGVGRFHESEHEKAKGIHRAEEKLMANSPRALARAGRERGGLAAVAKALGLGEIQASALRRLGRLCVA